MTRKEALTFFSLEETFDIDDLVDAQEEQLFELKKFFTTNVPIQKLFQSRLEKLKRMTLACEELNQGMFVATAIPPLEIDFSSDDILSVFQLYQEANKELKTKIAQSFNPNELLILIADLILVEKKYAEKWFHPDFNTEKVLVSKEVNPMEILRELKNYTGKTFTHLKKNDNSAPEILINEMKRLSLLFLKY